jgi:hypothetical protein
MYVQYNLRIFTLPILIPTDFFTLPWGGVKDLGNTVLS